MGNTWLQGRLGASPLRQCFFKVFCLFEMDGVVPLSEPHMTILGGPWLRVWGTRSRGGHETLMLWVRCGMQGPFLNLLMRPGLPTLTQGPSLHLLLCPQWVGSVSSLLPAQFLTGFPQNFCHGDVLCPSSTTDTVFLLFLYFQYCLR